MAQETFDTTFGIVTVRNIMIDIDGTNLEEGIEINNPEFFKPLEILGYINIDELEEDRLEDLIADNL